MGLYMRNLDSGLHFKFLIGNNASYSHVHNHTHGSCYCKNMNIFCQIKWKFGAVVLYVFTLNITLAEATIVLAIELPYIRVCVKWKLYLDLIKVKDTCPRISKKC